MTVWCLRESWETRVREVWYRTVLPLTSLCLGSPTDTLGTQELPHLWHLFCPDPASLCLLHILNI